MALCSHYLFEPCFTRIGTGHDKGGVEGRGKGIRLQHLVPIPRGDSVEGIAAELLAALSSALDAGQRHLLDLAALTREPMPEAIEVPSHCATTR